MRVINRVGTLVAGCLSIVAIAAVMGLIPGAEQLQATSAQAAANKSRPISSKSPSAQNRRVIVNVLVNRGLAGQ